MENETSDPADCILLLMLVGLLTVYIVYLSAWEADDLAANPLNMRSAAARADIRRGSILDARGRVLAQTRQDGSRSYPMGAAMAAVTGYNGEKSEAPEWKVMPTANCSAYLRICPGSVRYPSCFSPIRATMLS